MSADPWSRSRIWIDHRGPAVGQQFDDGSTIVYLIGAKDGRLIVVEVRATSPRGATRRLLAQASPATAIDVYLRESRPKVAAYPRELRAALDRRRDDPDWRVFIEALTAESTPDRHEARRRRLVTTAALYVEALRQGDRHPNEAVARQQDRSAANVRDDLKRARSAGYLTPAGGHGIPGGDLTPLARQLLEEWS